MSREFSSEERFREAFEQAAVGMAQLTLDGRWIQINQRLCEDLGYTREELLARSPGDLSHPDDVAVGYALGTAVGEGNGSPGPLEVRLIRKDGSPVWVQLNTATVRDPQGAPRFVIGVVEDISRRKLVEDELRETRHMEAIGRLAGGVAHDFNNVLTAIDGYGQLLLDDLSPGDPHRSDVEEIMQASRRAVVLTQQLLAFGRRQPMDYQLVDLAELVRGMAKSIQHLVGAHIELAVHAAGPLPPVRLDAQQFEQVVLALVRSAAEAIPERGRLRIDTGVEHLSSRREVATGTLLPGDYVTLSVSDTGERIEAQAASRIFEPYATARATGKGHGLGLSMAYGLVKQSDGNIAVEGQAGGGVVFRVYLPALADTKASRK